MGHIPTPIFHDKLQDIVWKKIYSREYGVQYSTMAIACISPQALHIIPTPSVDHVVVPDGANSAFYIDNHSWEKLIESLNRKYTTNIQRLETYEKGFLTTGKKYVHFTKKIARADLRRKTNLELLKIYLEYQDKLFNYTVFVWTAFFLNNYVSERAVSIVERYIRARRLKMKSQEILNALFEPRARAAVLQLQHEVEHTQKKLSRKMLNELYNRYKWLSCQDLHDSPWTKKQFAEAIEEFKNKQVQKPKPFSTYARLLDIAESDIQYLLVAQRFVYIKDVRDEFRRQGIYNILPFFAEIARRMKIRSQDVSYLQTSEIVDFLKKGKAPRNRTITKRKKGFAMYLDTKSKVVCLQGDDIQSALAEFKLAEHSTDTQKIKGTVASRGEARGTAVIVRGVKDLSKVKNGSILVAVATHPDYTIAMRKASAIITDEGGLTSHAAIVSREYGIPCIVGTQNATRVLKNGDRVVVNTRAGIVEKV